jgi:glycosyltransferase involved in cell wall biosynthesis
MCVIAPGYNNNANFRIENNLNSIFAQNYSNYKAVIINDASTDGSGDIYRRYF